MTEDSKLLAEISAAKEQFKDSIISSKKLGTERFTYTKNKKSQADGSTANVVIVKDKSNDSQFTIAVNVSSVIFKGKDKFTSDDRLDKLQDAISAFLENIHEEL